MFKPMVFGLVLVLGLGGCHPPGSSQAPRMSDAQLQALPAARFAYNDGLEQEVTLSPQFSFFLRRLVEERSQRWDPPGITAAPIGFLRFDGVQLELYGSVTDRTWVWNDPAFHRFWTVVTTQAPAQIAQFVP